MTTWFTADQHFGHTNIIRFCNRPFANVHEMDEAMIERWNDVVDYDDTVYQLGDFSLNNDIPWVRELKGHVYVVPGGHDRRWIGRHKKAPYYTQSGRVEILPPLFHLELEWTGSKYPLVLVLCHYVLESWDRSYHGSIHLHGHSHGRIPDGLCGNGIRIDVGVDSHNFYPFSLEEVLALAGGFTRRVRKARQS